MAEPGRVDLPGPYGGHPGPAFTVAYSPDGALLASGGWDGTVRVWNRTDGAEISVLTGHAGPVRAVAFSPHGPLLASCGRDRTIRLWDTTAYTSAGVLRGHGGAVVSLAFHPEGRLLASADDEGTIRLWNTLDGSTLDELAVDARSLAFSPDGGLLATAGRAGQIRLWRFDTRLDTRLDTRAASPAIGAHDGPVLSLAFAPGQPLLASSGRDGLVRLWNPLDGTKLGESRDDYASSLAFSPDCRVLASAGRAAGIVLREVADLARATQLEATRRPYNLAFAPDGGQLASANDEGDICLYDLAGRADPVSLAGHSCEILSVACSPDGALVATGDVDGAIRIWETTRGSLVNRVTAQREWVRSLAFDGSGTLLVAEIGGIINTWDVPHGFAEVSVPREPMRLPVTALAVSPAAAGPALLVTADRDGLLTSWNLRDGKEAAASGPAVAGAVAVAAAPDGTVISADATGHVRVWDRALSDASPRLFWPALGRPRCVAVRPDGQVLAAAGDDGTISLWHVRQPAAPLATRYEHRGAVRALVFSPDGTLLASAGDDGTIRLWAAADGSPVRTLVDRAVVVRSLAFAPDGGTLFSVGDDGRINRWNPLTGQPLDNGRRQAGSLPSVPGIRSDEPSRHDWLGQDADVKMLATLIAAASTEPPLAVALLGEWGAGKSSVMLQVQDEVDLLAVRARAGDPAYAANLCQIRFNAWHYSDEQVWTGLIDHLFRRLAAAAGSNGPPPDPDQVRGERDRLRRALADEEQRCAELDRQRSRLARGALAVLGRALWRNRLPLLVRGLVTCVYFVFLAFQLLPSGLVSALGRAWNQARSARQAANWPADMLAEETRQAQERRAALEDQLAQVDAAVRLSLLLKRHGSGDSYGAARGLLGQVHRDLEQLSTDLDGLRQERQAAGQLVPPPLERIVLYIDDLDRCPPARVVEVLAAVHLMLALPLFVVVVAVDPRWLREALRHHHRELFAGSFAPGDHLSSPADYLDKIFQIPFTVRSLSAAGAAGFLGSLVGSAQEDALADPGEAGPVTPGGKTPDPPAPPGAPATAHPLPPEGLRDPDDRPDPEDRPSPARPGSATLPGRRPGGLILRAPETEFIVRLGPLLRTPRAAKKLVNLYRLVRIGIPEEDLPRFIGLGGYKVVQIALAILVGVPDAAPAIFTAVGAAPTDADIVDVVRAAEPNAGPQVAGFINDIRSQSPEAVTDIRVYQRWCPALARYSFYTR
jgi:WD40 repeat protein